jgi:hypothetical protein
MTGDAFIILGGLVLIAVAIMTGAGMICGSIEAKKGHDGGLWPKPED